MARSHPAFALLAFVPALAFASGVFSDQLTVSGTQATATDPRSGSIADRLGADGDLSDDWALHGDVTLTREGATPPVNGAAFGDTGGTIFDLAAGVDHDFTDQLTATLDVELSPKSTTSSNAGLAIPTFTGTSLDVDTRLTTRGSSAGATASLSWLSADPDADWQTALDVSFGGEHFSWQERVTAVAGKTGTLSPQEVKAGCDNVLAESLPTDTGSTAYKKLLLQKATCRALLPALSGEDASLGQGTLALGVTETLYQDTDVSLSGSYAFYSEDPTQVGYFTLATVGRRHVSLGDGVDVAPVRWTLGPRVAHRFGGLQAEISLGYAQYVPGEGHSSKLGLRLDYKFTRTYRAFLKLNGQADVDGADQTTHSGSVGAGLQVAF